MTEKPKTDVELDLDELNIIRDALFLTMKKWDFMDPNKALHQKIEMIIKKVELRDA